MPFDSKSIIGYHYLKQISGIREELKEGLYPYKLEDLLNLKRFHSLSLLKYEERWSKFITKLHSKIK